MCTYVSINDAVISDQSYVINSGNVTLATLAWTPSIIGCSIVTYTLTYSNDTVIDSIFSLDSSTITISTSNHLKVGSHVLKVSGTISPYTGAVASRTFTVTVTDDCHLATITPVAVTSPIYYSGNATLSYTITDWSIDKSYCGSLTYTASLNGTQLPVLADASNILGFDATTMTMTVYNTDLAVTGDYIMELRATMSNAITEVITFT